MYLSIVKVKGFINFKDNININFNKGLNVLVGKNSCGKTKTFYSRSIL